MATIPSYFEGLLTPQDLEGLRGQAMTAGLLSAGQALARSGAPSLTPGGGTGIADAAAQFYGSYQGTIDSALQNMIRAQQVQEMVRKQKEAQQMRQVLSSALIPQYQTIPATQTAIPSEVGPAVVETPATQQLTGYTFDINKAVPILAGTGNFEMLKNLQEVQSLFGGSTMKPSDVAGNVKEAIQVLGIKDDKGRLKTPDLFTAEDQKRVNDYINIKTSNLAPKVNVSDPTAVATAQANNVKDFNAQVKDFREVSRRYNAMVDAHKDKANPATDSTLIYGLAKIYDPTGAVQQGDIGTIKGKRSIPESVVGLAERVSRGGTLTPQERDNIISTAYSMVNSYSKSVQPDVDTYRTFSKSFGADPNQIRNPFENLAKPDYIFVTIGGGQVKATKANDGNYYIQRGDKYYKVSD